MVLLVVGALLGAFLLGSIPFGVVFARARGVDLRKVGSGNIGATNAARALGKHLGVIVLLCDAAKGWLPVLLARHYLEARVVHGEFLVAGVGVAAFLGHLAPPWLGFRGGKGVATGLGVFLALSVWPALIAVACFVAVYAMARVSSLGSLVAATAVLPALFLFDAPTAYLAAAGTMWVLIVWKHRSNIERLLKHAENKV
ncbi:MAG: glycerol-3-phosphate 1-O-acyltransferase [Myxococcales bacterium]|nr:glycerol-3-phosphate 1-O-acyltransferase [Myxococcales bacterium]